MPGQNRSPQVGLCTKSCSSRDENQTSCWCWNLSQGFDSFVLLHLWFWGEIQLGAEWNYKHRLWLTQGHHGSLWECCKPQPRWEPKGLCPMLSGTGKQIREVIPDLCSVQRVQSLRNCIRKCPLCQHDKAKEPHKDWELLVVASPGKKKFNLFIPGMGRSP